jgi:hypothetical protein
MIEYPQKWPKFRSDREQVIQDYISRRSKTHYKKKLQSLILVRKALKIYHSEIRVRRASQRLSVFMCFKFKIEMKRRIARNVETVNQRRIKYSYNFLSIVLRRQEVPKAQLIVSEVV